MKCGILLHYVDLAFYILFRRAGLSFLFIYVNIIQRHYMFWHNWQRSCVPVSFTPWCCAATHVFSFFTRMSCMSVKRGSCFNYMNSIKLV
jgi:hypothetical protein